MRNEYVETIGIRKDVKVFERPNSLNPVGIGINKTASGIYADELYTEGYDFVILSIEEAEKLIEHINNIINKTRR